MKKYEFCIVLRVSVEAATKAEARALARMDARSLKGSCRPESMGTLVRANHARVTDIERG
jgi:hypothetical protein